MRKLWEWSRGGGIGVLIGLGCTQNGVFSASALVAASDFQFFGSEIDFWHERQMGPRIEVGKEVRPPVVERKESEQGKGGKEGKEVQVKSENGGSNFEWNKYLDPKNKEFFKEGDYTPPEPFMEIVRNPTDANLKNWFAYIDKKNELSKQLQVRMQEYMARNQLASGAPAGGGVMSGAGVGGGAGLTAEAAELIRAKFAALPVTAPDAKRYRFRMYFDSHCPHCRKMFDTLAELQRKGFYVEAKQVDSDPHGTEGVGIPTARVVPGELKEKDIQSVPVLFIGDVQTRAVYRLSGYQSTESVFAAISKNRENVL